MAFKHLGCFIMYVCLLFNNSCATNHQSSLTTLQTSGSEEYHIKNDSDSKLLKFLIIAKKQNAIF